MNGKYKGIGGKSVAGLLLCLLGVLTACEDDFGKNGPNSGALTMKVAVPEGWTSGIAVDESSPDSRCVSVDAAASESAIPLYLHTIESDNAVAVPSTRGALKTAVERFSMSAICYKSEDDISGHTPNFAHDLTCRVGGDGTASCSEPLLWPAKGNVRFFAFAPLNEDLTKPFALSGADAIGSPTITYTVPDKIADQYDLMAACTDATSPAVKLEFRHILTAVKVVTAKDMIPGTITKVTFSGIPNKGTYTPGTGVDEDKWVIDKTSKGASYTVERDVTIEGGYQGSGDNVVGTDEGGKEVIGETDNLTLLMIPQTLPEGAKLEVTFKEDLSGKVYTLSADLKGKTWPAGKILTYSISPSSINIQPVVKFNKKPDDTLPYSGVWHDVEVSACVRVTKERSEPEIRASQIPEIQYSFDDGNTYSSSKFYDSNGNELKAAASAGSSNVRAESETTNEKNMCILEPQSDFKLLQGELNGDFDTDKVINLYEESGNESANCYMVDKPGYYRFPVVYGNTYKAGGLNAAAITIEEPVVKDGMRYYPDYKGKEIKGYNISEGDDAVLAWQDAPDLIDKVELMSEKENGVSWVQFRVRKHSITQGNALIVVRDADDVIVWSWHIWVSKHTKAWRTGVSNCRPVKSIYKKGGNYEFTGNKYDLADVNLGYCDPHDGNDERKFKIRFKVTVNNSEIMVTKYEYTDGAIINTKEKEFTQAEFKGSLAGDNTYYQWGRSAPTPGGIYNKSTPKYYYKSSNDYSELNMENKPLFYNDGNDSYGLRRNPSSTGDSVDETEKGVTIDWAIRNPHVFKMSQYDKEYVSGMENYRDHWHQFINKDNIPDYAVNSTSELLQMWNPKATMLDKAMTSKEDDVVKSVYDPCPAGYIVPPANLFSAFAYCATYGNYCVYDNEVYNDAMSSVDYKTNVAQSGVNNTWRVTANGVSFDFPATGLRNKSLRFKDFSTVKLALSTRADSDPCNLRDQTYPAFRMLTYLSSSTMGNNGQVSLFYIDSRHYYTDKENKQERKGETGVKSLEMFSLNDEPAIACCQLSANSYGLSVRPMKDK